MSTLESNLSSWPALNAKLRVATEKECYRLMIAEARHKRRLQFLLRIYGRYNKLRGLRERQGLLTEGRLTA